MKDSNKGPRRMYGGKMRTEAQIEKRKLSNKKWRLENKDKIKKQRADKYQENRDIVLEKVKIYNEKHGDRIQERKRKHRQENPEIYAERGREYYLANASKIKERRYDYEKKRLSIDPVFKALKNMRRRLSHAVHDQGTMKVDTSMKLFGCSAEVLKKHLEAQFTDGMSWDNYGTHGWHIDHIKPCASFDLTVDEEQKKCFNYSNLQPLWAEDNIRKSDKYQFTTTK